MERLPQYGEWHVSNNLTTANAPFAILTVNFAQTSGSVRYLQTTTALAGIRATGNDRFRADFSINRTTGTIEAQYLDDQTLDLAITIGTDTIHYKARPSRLVGGERPVSQWSMGERLNVAIRRSFPKLPREAVVEIERMLTPAALMIMGGAIAFWGVSHFFGAGEIADFILLVAGAAMLGYAAIDVADHLIQFGVLITRATTEADIDAAAEHFAAAVIKGGVQVVMAVLLWRGRGARPQLRAPGKSGSAAAEAAEVEAVLPSRIPAASRVAARLAEVGDQPRLGSLAPELAARVRAMLNDTRARDLVAVTDCWGESLNLLKLAGEGAVTEGNAWSKITRFDHTVFEIAGEFIDTRPGMWIKHFREHPSIRAALGDLAVRLERGAVLTFEEFMRFKGEALPPGFQRVPVPKRPG